MFGKYRKLEDELSEVKDELVGYSFCGNSFKEPAIYSIKGMLENANKKIIEQGVTIDMLLKELGYSIEEGKRLVKNKKGR